MSNLSIGQVAKMAGVGIETIRYYERKGLIPKPQRKESGYRQYNNQAIDQLTFILEAKKLGFTLTEIHELLSLELRHGTTSKEIKQLTQSKLNDIDGKIKMLKRMQRTLKELVVQCNGQGPVSQCPILNAIKKK